MMDTDSPSFSSKSAHSLRRERWVGCGSGRSARGTKRPDASGRWPLQQQSHCTRIPHAALRFGAAETVASG